MRWLMTKYDGACAHCKTALFPGDRALYDRSTRSLYCEPCGLTPEAMPSFADRRAEQASIDAARAERADKYADKAGDRSDAAHAASRAILDRFEFGQPILVGHHSERRARRDADRAWNLMGRSVEEQETAAYWERKAAAAEERSKQDDDLGYCMRRRDEAEREIRDCDRQIAKSPGDINAGYRARMEARRADFADRLAYYEGRIAALGGPRFGPHNVTVGDFVYAYGWHKVRRVNRKSVTVPSIVGGSWTDTIPWDKIRAHRPASDGPPAA